MFTCGAQGKRGLDEYHRFDLGAGQMRTVRKRRASVLCILNSRYLESLGK